MIIKDEEKPLLESLIKMKTELLNLNKIMEERSKNTSLQIGQIESQRDLAINEATISKARLAAIISTTNDGNGNNNIDDHINELNKKLSITINKYTELNKKVEIITKEYETEKEARLLAEESIEILKSSSTNNGSNSNAEIDSLRQELSEIQKIAREESIKSLEATTAHKLIQIDKDDLNLKLQTSLIKSDNHESILSSLKLAIESSESKTILLEQQIGQERSARNDIESQLSIIKLQHDEKIKELESLTRKLKDVQELSDKNGKESKLHRLALIDGLNKINNNNNNNDNDNNINNNNEERIKILMNKIESSNLLIKDNQNQANIATEKLRKAEERIAGLETYQEQSTREGITFRKQLQSSLKDNSTLQEEKLKLQQQLDLLKLESNAVNIQHNTLKDILLERGINNSNDFIINNNNNRRRSSDNNINKLKELELQLESSQKIQDELKSRLDEMQEKDDITRKEYEEKLSSLDSDHQAAAKYLRGTEKMLSKMKLELQKAKQQASDYLEEIENIKTGQQPIQKDILSKALKPLEDEISTLSSDLKLKQEELLSINNSHENIQKNLINLKTEHDQVKIDSEKLKKENIILDQRAKEAEQKVQLLLDQVENSVDNYRRQTIDTDMVNNNNTPSKSIKSHSRNTSSTSFNDDDNDNDNNNKRGRLLSEKRNSNDKNINNDNGSITPRERNSLALNSLADELDGLRYRLSGKFDFEGHNNNTNNNNGTRHDSNDEIDPGSALSFTEAGLDGWRKVLLHEGVDKKDENEGESPLGDDVVVK